MKKGIIQKLAFAVSFLSFCVLLFPASGLHLIIAAGCFLATLLLLGTALFFLHKTGFKKAKTIFYDIIALILLAQDFCLRWQASSKIVAIAHHFHMNGSLLLLLVSISLSLLSVFSLNTLRALAGDFVEKHSQAQSVFGKPVRRLLLITVLVFLQFLMLEYGAVGSLSSILQRSPASILANCFILGLLNLTLVFVFQKWHITLFFSAILTALWGIADYYTILFHGSPLYLSEFANARTAAHVALQYHYRLSGQVVCILALLALSLILIHNQRESLDLSLPIGRKLVLRTAALAAISAASFLLGRQSISLIRPWMPWNVAVEESGFLVCTIQDTVQRLDPVFKPEDYDEGHFPQKIEVVYPEQEEYPDIILVLNETLCDLSLYTEMNADRDYLDAFFGITGASYGWAAAPNIGGGTNNSEFELLTSKSMYLLKAIAPFTFLDQAILERNTIQVLSDNGYSSAAMHCERAENYSRDRSYPAMGFKQVLLGPESFSNRESYGNRKWLDSENYADMDLAYQQMGEGPRFVYLLTFQNHGGYEQNDASMDTVHVRNDFGDLTDDLDEYLSSLELSAKAFRELAEYYAECERKVIICMVGDHAPSFITSLPAKSGMSFEESEIAKRLVPYVIWSNYGAEIPSYSEYASMVDLLPMVMEAAGLPLPTFYRYILDLHEDYPVRTANGLYMDAEGNYGSIFDDPQARGRMSIYYNMEYNSLTTDGSYRSELFEVK